MPYVKKGSQTEIGQKIEELAKKVPAPLSWIVPDPYTDPTGGFSITPSPVGLTRQAGVKELLKPLFNRPTGALSAAGRKEVSDALRIWGATPKKLQQYIKELELSWPEKVGHHQSFTGAYTPTYQKINLAPTTIKEPATLADALSHELGHGYTERLGNRLMKSHRIEGDIIDMYDWVPTKMEALSEYIGSGLKKKANLSSTPPVFGYGPKQQEAFSVLERGKGNFWQNASQYIKDILINLNIGD